MKALKTLFFVIFLSLIANSANAQSWGIRAGANFSTLSNSDAKSQTGYYGGVYRQFGIVKDFLYIQPELQFSKQGFDTDLSTVDLNYIHLPIVARVYVLKLLSFETGPQFGFLVSDNADNFDFNSVDTSWDFGMSINLPFRLSIDARYITSLNELIEGRDSKSQVIQVGASFRF
ncbi:Outer membrane protein beta-barrel domain-containing protein [Flavobacterium fluvii]|uniref:Outer membrane protein beta-barrel domain-containing protein n=1 Tax=Flavobacterium fluvii TaxID=468056 RepID=A0A1M5NST4_9FLAO|nr:porin family protein [Flavobacterium fluvii]SHG92616.1 Outer membrane protein beta-barrel domain-containing protein [Flavobacterium fluvii]